MGAWYQEGDRVVMMSFRFDFCLFCVAGKKCLIIL